jgi:hypothetical protein
MEKDTKDINDDIKLAVTIMFAIVMVHSVYWLINPVPFLQTPAPRFFH